jgi:hypothetical protein
MTLIAEMSVGLSEEYRDGKKGKLQRTFISGTLHTFPRPPHL